MDEQTRRGVLAGIGLATAGCLGRSEERSIYTDYPTTTVAAVTPDDTQRATVTAAIADDRSERRQGLSATETLRPGWGMLFVFETAASREFYMKNMEFGIDIIYAGADGRITRMHHAPAPGPEENGAAQRYHGNGQYVLEVPYDWTTEHGVTPDDRLVFDLPE
ncbi:MAG: DUF192 domain-containing protein [Salinarchaeum sp.]